jgi:hypothetical protein
MTEVPLNIPHAHTFVPSAAPASMVVYGPSLAVSKAANGYGYVADPGGGKGYSCSFLPDEVGRWTVVLLDGGGTVVHYEQFDCVWSTPEDLAHHVTNRYHGTVDVYWPFYAWRQAQKTVTSLTAVGTTVTATVAAHGYTTGQNVTIFGAVPDAYNGAHNVTVTGVNTFTYSASSAPSSSPAGGTTLRCADTTTGAIKTAIDNATSTYAAFVSAKKLVVPYSGYVYGVRWTGTAEVHNMTSVRFFTMLPDGTYKVRGISEDVHATVPTEGNYVSSADGYYTVWFKNPIPARQGDYWGYEVQAPGGKTSTTHSLRTTLWSFPTATQEIKFRASNVSGISLTAANTFGAYGGGVTDALDVKLVVRPPSIALAGHSFYSGFGDTAPGTVSTFDYNTQNNSRPFDPTQDLAALIEQHLGVPVVNVAVGGSSLPHWVGQPQIGVGNDNSGLGWFELLVAPLRPAVLLYDSDYNDADPGTAMTAADYYGYLDRLLRHCRKYAIELVLIEAPPSESAAADARVTSLERFRVAKRLWARQNHVCLIPSYHAMGANSGTEPAYKRYAMKGGDTYLGDYQDGALVHFSDTSRPAMAALLAEGIRLRRPAGVLTAPAPVDEATQLQPAAKGFQYR